VRDCLFAPGEDLVRVRSNRGAFVLNGKHVAGWLEQLAPYLDGRRSLEALTAALPAARREAVGKLVAMLTEQGVVHDLDLELPHGLTEQELAAAGPEIAYIDSCSGSGAHHFGRFRETPVLVLGAAPIAAALAAQVRALGCRRVEVAGPDADLAEPAPSLLPGLVLTCTECPSRLTAANRACRSSGRALLPIAVAGEVAWIGPLVRPDQPGCWECAWRRLADRTVGGAGRLAGPISTALLASRAAFEVFKVVTGSGRAEVTGGLVRLDLGTGLSERHPFHPHPLCEACAGDRVQAGLRERWSVASGRGEWLTAEVVRSADDLVDPDCGILRGLGEEDLPQLPYRATRAVVASPLPDGDPVMVAATAETLAESRARAVGRALASYGQALCESRLADVWAWDLVREAPARISEAGPAGLVSSSGSTWAAALASALFEHSVRLLDAGGLPEIGLEAESLADPYLAWTRRLAAVIGLSPTLLDLTVELGVPAVAAVIDGACVAHAAAAGQARAAALAMEAVISRWQLGQSDPEIRFEMGDMPGVELCRALAGRLLDRGWRPLAIPLDEDRAVASVCPHLVTVALVRCSGNQ
jgi:bacteriocin biosynthesis cyclodehydratase domain-containing protein